MKVISLTLFLALSLTLALSATEVQPGDSLFDVRATLGAPRGQVRVGNQHLLYYDRGEIELQAGAVTRVALLSVEDQAALEAKRAADAVRIREEREIRRASLGAEGEALKARKLADQSFQTAPVAYQVSFWEDFSRRYPDVPVAEQLTIARLRLAGELEERRAKAEQAERLANLEARVIEAEARVAEAESVAARTRNYSSFNGYSYRGRGHHSLNFMPVEYRYFDAPLPYATSPGMPPMQPTYRNEYNRRLNDRPDYVRRDGSYDGDSRRSPGRGRL